MKKRLRKKTYIGEFKEWGVTISITRSKDADFETFLDEFIEQSMEGNACYFTGTGEKKHLEGFIDLGRSLDKSEAKLAHVTAWLDKRSDVKKYAMGKLADAWYGPFHPQDEPDTSN